MNMQFKATEGKSEFEWREWDERELKKILMVFLLLSVVPVWCEARSVERARLVAEVMGDIVLQRDDGQEKARMLQRKVEQLDGMVDLAGKGDDTQAWRMLEAFSRVLMRSGDDGEISADELRRVVAEYERFHERVVGQHQDDPVFRMMDLRFRYLAGTLPLASQEASRLPIRRSVEDTYEETDRLMSRVIGGKGDRIVRNWNFLGKLIADYRRRPVPHMVNAMIIQLCADPGFI